MENNRQFLNMPNRLYKYREFDSRMLKIVVNDQVYFADPSTFNDPLDTRPSVESDVENGELERILRALLEQRGHLQADQLIDDIEYNASDPEYESESLKASLLVQAIEKELLQRYDKGIVSFSERSDCPLMWSHYGDQHHGICIGYSVPSNTAGSIQKVKYNGSRRVQASKIAAMVDGNDGARGEVDEAVLLQKAESWEYEQEWRLIGSRGLKDSPLELEEIIFGMRCDPVAKYIVMKVLEGRDRLVKFFEMREIPGTFRLQKCKFNDDQIFEYFPRRSLSIFEMFEPWLTAESSTKEE